MKVELPAVRKRKQESRGIDVAESCASWKRIRELDHKALLDPEKVTKIPYPGIGDPGPRPGREVEVIYLTFIERWNDDIPDDGGVVFVGSKGIGKSVFLRVFACIQFAKAPANVRILCIWDLSWLKFDMVRTVKNALRFAYFTQAEERAAVELLDSVEDIHGFMSEQMTRKKETFWFILDGVDALDAETWYGEKQKDADVCQQVKRSLNLLLKGCKVLWCVSPKSEIADADETKPADNVGRVECNEGFGDKALKTFMSTSLLGAVIEESDKRKTDVAWYAGSYPWFLRIMDDCCREVACGIESAKVSLSQGVRMLMPDLRESMTRETAHDLLQSEESWGRVLAAFQKHRSISSIKKDLDRNLKVTTPDYYWSDMIEIDPRYTLTKEFRSWSYCSPYVKEVYECAFRKLADRRR